MFRFPFGTVQELNLDWFLEQWEIFKQEAQTAFDGIDHALDAEIQRVEDAMTDLYAARDAAIAAKNDSLSYAQSANSSAIGASQSAQNSAASAITSANQAASAAQSATAADGSATAAIASATAAETSATQAGNSATAAQNSAQSAGSSAGNALAQAQNSEAWAIGSIGGVPVPPTADQYENNAKYYAESISGDAAAAAQSASDAAASAASVSQSEAQIAKNATDIGDLKSSTNLVTDATFLEWQSGYYTTSADGGNITLTSSSAAACTHVDVSPGDIVFINAGAQSSTARLYVFADSNGNAFGRSGANLNGSYYVEVPSGATHIYINNIFEVKASGYYAYKGAGVPTLKDISDGTKKIKILTGIIRNAGSGWGLISDTDHSPLNMASVEVNESGAIVVNYGFTAKKVLTLVATPDETFARDYTLGASVANDKATFNVYRLPFMIGGVVSYDSTNNTWNISGSNFTAASFDTATKRLTLTHASVSGSAGSPRNCCNVNGYDCDPRIRSLDNTSIQIIFLNSDGTTMDAPTSNMTFYISRFVPCLFANANDISNANGNFWLMGVMEI